MTDREEKSGTGADETYWTEWREALKEWTSRLPEESDELGTYESADILSKGLVLIFKATVKYFSFEDLATFLREDEEIFFAWAYR